MFFLPLDLRQPLARLESMLVTAGAASGGHLVQLQPTYFDLKQRDRSLFDIIV